MRLHVNCACATDTSLNLDPLCGAQELFKQCVQDIPAIRKAKYPLVIDREQAMINAIEAKLPNLTVP